MKRWNTFALVALLLTGAAQIQAQAQDKYPSRPIKVIVPYAPGGATDIVARIVGDEFQKITEQGLRRDQQAGRQRPARDRGSRKGCARRLHCSMRLT